MDCIFCKISNHEIPAKIHYEDDEVIAFEDINPGAKTHVLIIPKRHIEAISTLRSEDQSVLGKLIITAKKLAKELEIEESGYRLVANCGADAGAVVDHLHFHLLGGEKLGPIA